MEVQRLPLTKTPFADIAGRLDMTETQVIETCKQLLDKGIIRRIAPSISHRKAGLGANPMTVLKVPDDKLDEIGNTIAGFAEVTHCYARTGWDYNLFFMLHGKTKELAVEQVKKIINELGIEDYRILFSTREFKKISFELPQINNGGEEI